MNRPPPPAWPVLLEDDPWDTLPRDLGYDDFVRTRGRMDRDVYEADALRLVSDIRRGRPVDELAARLRVEGGIPPRPYRPEPVKHGCADRGTLARVALDRNPAAGADGPDRVLGPWSDTLCLRRHGDRHSALLRVAVAATCFLPVDDRSGTTPRSRWARDEPRPPVPVRARVRASARAPWSLWALQDGLWSDLLEVASVRGSLPAPPCIVDAPPRYLVGKVVVADDGTLSAPVGVGLDEVPPVARVRAWERTLSCRWRLTDRRAPRPVLLARHGHQLARRILEWRWLRATVPRSPR